MKKLLFFVVAFIAVFAVSIKPAAAAKPVDACAYIKDGTIQYGSNGDTNTTLILLGYDQWGYNYQAHMFNGWYDNSSRPTTLATGGDLLMMKWNDAWLSSKDCGTQIGREGDFTSLVIPDKKLDRHYGYPTYKDSGAWLTNHASGTYQSATASSWDITGTWDAVHEYQVNTYPHHNDITQASDGTLTGSGGWDGTQNGNPVNTPNTWEITSGSVSGNTVHFDYHYTSVEICATDGFVDATIHSDGSMTGTWTDNCGGADARSGSWTVEAGKAIASYDTCSWSDFVKIVAVRSTDYFEGGYWYTDDTKTTEIGPSIWGSFAIIQEESTDPCGESDDLMNYKSELRAGLGNW